MVFCEFCGASLIGKQPLDTKSLDSKEEAKHGQYGVDTDALTDVRAQGTSTFEESDRLRLEIEGCPDPLLFEVKEEAIFGRKDPATGAMPDIDLTPYAGYRMGVSRRHAAIARNATQGLDVRDLGSSNGTFLNGQQLVAHRLYHLRNGDELRLGQMVIRVIFEPTQPAKTAPESKKTAPPSKPQKTPAKTLTTQRPEQLTAGTDAAQAEEKQAAEQSPAQKAEAKSAPPAQAEKAPTAASKESEQPPADAKAQSADVSTEDKKSPEAASETSDKPNAEDKDKRD